MTDDKTPMERFEDLARKVFSKPKGPEKHPGIEEDALVVVEGDDEPTERPEPDE